MSRIQVQGSIAVRRKVACGRRHRPLAREPLPVAAAETYLAVGRAERALFSWLVIPSRGLWHLTVLVIGSQEVLVIATKLLFALPQYLCFGFSQLHINEKGLEVCAGVG